ncbi:MAG TPA: hypothetical protein VJX67_14815, partial [Blastocatellia bacterium]|nr:hypothetical protein [Blastocatellia bacterium]
MPRKGGAICNGSGTLSIVFAANRPIGAELGGTPLSAGWIRPCFAELAHSYRSLLHGGSHGLP